jgi:hypothetical protein
MYCITGCTFSFLTNSVFRIHVNFNADQDPVSSVSDPDWKLSLWVTEFIRIRISAREPLPDKLCCENAMAINFTRWYGLLLSPITRQQNSYVKQKVKRQTLTSPPPPLYHPLLQPFYPHKHLSLHQIRSQPLHITIRSMDPDPRGKE